jgi:CO/xanthine dehydrogenase Mo-binding subunit
MSRNQEIGVAKPMVDASPKARGEARFAADIQLPNLAVAKLLPSLHAHAEVLSIDTSVAEAMPGVYAVITGSDIPEVEGFDPYDHAHGFLARRFAVHVGQPVAAVAAKDPSTAEEALAAIRVAYRVLAPILNAAAALEPGQPVVSRDATASPSEESPSNNAGDAEMINGDLDAGFASADVVLEETYEIPMIHQGYLEPHAVTAWWKQQGHVDVWECVQSPFGARDHIVQTLGIPAHKIALHTTDIGGAFGGKDQGLFSPIAVLLAKKAERPVRLALTREEELTIANPAPMTKIRLKVGVSSNGAITAVDGEVRVDVGAFRTYWGPASFSVCHMLVDKYRVPAFRLHAQDVFTNRVGFGSYRAPMAVQAAFAIESMLDELGCRLGIDPIEMRKRNLISEGEVGAGGAPMPKHGGTAVLQSLMNHAAWRGTKSGRNEDGMCYGRGFALGLWGSGAFPAAAIARLEKGGYVRFTIGQVDLTGSYTSLAQIAAEELGISADRIVFSRADTSRAPFASVSGGSSTIYSMGGAVQEAARELREKIVERAALELDVDRSELRMNDVAVTVEGKSDKRIELDALYEAETSLFFAKYEPFVARGAKGGRVSRMSAPCFSGTIAEVAVNPETGAVKVLRLVTAQDVGKAINPMLVEGQIQGAAAQSVGAALWEAVEYDDAGRVRNADLLDYRLPTAADLPKIETILIEEEGGDGPFGAKGVGEPPMIAPAAAVANAIRNAIGQRINQLPLNPESIWQAMQ